MTSKAVAPHRLRTAAVGPRLGPAAASWKEQKKEPPEAATGNKDPQSEGVPGQPRTLTLLKRIGVGGSGSGRQLVTLGIRSLV